MTAPNIDDLERLYNERRNDRPMVLTTPVRRGETVFRISDTQVIVRQGRAWYLAAFDPEVHGRLPVILPNQLADRARRRRHRNATRLATLVTIAVVGLYVLQAIVGLIIGAG